MPDMSGTMCEKSALSDNDMREPPPFCNTQTFGYAPFIIGFAGWQEKCIDFF
jgi:hypothetical protein